MIRSILPVFFTFFAINWQTYKVIADELPTVTIPQGVVKGHYMKSFNGKTFAAFEGIPYAEPPSKDLRFKEPVPAGKFSGIIYANKTYICLQFSPIPMMAGPMGQEDCLYVNVYVPHEKVNTDNLLDVVVHIHGGAFMIGSPSQFAGPDYIMDKEVVYATMNYRVGILGFLSTEDDVVPGNNGLKDQSLALKWIKENIKYFGGNPDSITLTGQSAGGASVHYHYFSQKSKALFHRGWSISGTALQPWALTRQPGTKARKLGEILSCPTDSSEKMISCMRQTPSRKLINAVEKFFVIVNAVPYTPFGPVVEKGGKNPFITESPREMMKKGRIENDVPWISSNTRDEGVIPVGVFVILNEVENIDLKWNEIAPYAMDFYDTIPSEQQQAISKQIREHYFHTEKITNSNIKTLIKLFTDRVYLVNSREALDLHSKASKSPVYYYFYSYVLDMPFIFKMNQSVSHCDDSKLLFKLMTNPKHLTQSDANMKNLLLDLLYTYATEGKPKVKGVDWKTVVPDGKYLDIVSASNYNIKDLKSWDEAKFWNSLKI